MGFLLPGWMSCLFLILKLDPFCCAWWCVSLNVPLNIFTVSLFWFSVAPLALSCLLSNLPGGYLVMRGGASNTYGSSCTLDSRWWASSSELWPSLSPLQPFPTWARPHVVSTLHIRSNRPSLHFQPWTCFLSPNRQVTYAKHFLSIAGRYAWRQRRHSAPGFRLLRGGPDLDAGEHSNLLLSRVVHTCVHLVLHHWRS